MLERSSVDIYCIQETRFKGRSVRMISGKAAEYKLFWIVNGNGLGEVEIFLAKKWVDTVIDISRVSDRMIAIKVSVQGIISVISAYAHDVV